MMTETTSCDCGCGSEDSQVIMGILPAMPECESRDETGDISCCGAPVGPPADPWEKPGYSVCSFVDGFIETAAGPIPRVSPRMKARDHLGTLRVRIGIGRNNYKVAPGLYAMGDPDEASPVVVTANYKLSFDHVRTALGQADVWLLVLDTRGINVWCAAGKGTFGTAELIRKVNGTGLSRLVSHRKLIVPQLGAVGITGREVTRATGFTVKWGPVRAIDLPAFIRAGMEADTAMRRVTFTAWERFILTPVELTNIGKAALIALVCMLVLSGIGDGGYAFSQIPARGIPGSLVLFSGVIAGAVVTPVLLPWVPGTAFALKGIVSGGLIGLIAAIVAAGFTGAAGVIGLILLASAVSSWLAMNYTGSTPFTAPSGVEAEMRRYIPIQIGLAVSGLVLWVVSGF